MLATTTRQKYGSNATTGGNESKSTAYDVQQQQQQELTMLETKPPSRIRLNVNVYGGSITYGGGVTSPNNIYSEVFVKLVNKELPNIDLNITNNGM